MFADIGSFTQTRARRGFPGGSRLAGLRAFPGASGRCGGRVRIPLMNQNLLYLVFKCSFSTKHSGSIPVAQGRDSAQTAARKRASETGVWRAIPGISPRFPGVVHRVFHEMRRLSAQGGRCSFATGNQRVALRCATVAPDPPSREEPRRARNCNATRARRWRGAFRRLAVVAPVSCRADANIRVNGP